MENDYILKMIKSALQGIAYILKGKKSIEENIDLKRENIVLNEEELLELTIIHLLSECKINEAENILFESIKKNKSPKYLSLAFFFYNEINEWSNEKLSDCNFSRDEILNGLNDVKKIYDI